MALPGAEHVPYLSLDSGGIAFASASKAWNVAGLKCAVVVAGSEETLTAFGRVPGHVHYQLGHFGRTTASKPIRRTSCTFTLRSAAA